MKEFFPNYYEKFKCIADRCVHCCCVGWEIDIDDDTLHFYNSLDSELGDRIRNSIDTDPPHFILNQGDRCPFLNSCGLCDIISEYGEDALCDICYLHPRFRNFYSGCIETGLGASCEEAARIILGFEEKFSVSSDNTLFDDEELALIEERAKIFSILQDREKTISERFSLLASEYSVLLNKPLDALCKFYLSLERLDEEWTGEIGRLKEYKFKNRIFGKEEFALMFEQMTVYFIFRHMIRVLDRWDASVIVDFALTSVFIIGALCEMHGCIASDIAEYFRMYSSEVEYSEDNTEAILAALSEGMI